MQVVFEVLSKSGCSSSWGRGGRIESAELLDVAGSLKKLNSSAVSCADWSVSLSDLTAIDYGFKHARSSLLAVLLVSQGCSGAVIDDGFACRVWVVLARLRGFYCTKMATLGAATIGPQQRTKNWCLS